MSISNTFVNNEKIIKTIFFLIYIQCLVMYNIENDFIKYRINLIQTNVKKYFIYETVAFNNNKNYSLT